MWLIEPLEDNISTKIIFVIGTLDKVTLNSPDTTDNQ